MIRVVRQGVTQGHLSQSQASLVELEPGEAAAVEAFGHTGCPVIVALQYLEGEVGELSAADVRAELRRAAARLPFTDLLLGWNVPPALLETCANEVGRLGASLYRWHPLLTGDGVFSARPEWQVVGPTGEPVPVFGGLPEFTFVCPNRPAARDAVLEHLARSLEGGGYDGVFLDRMRYPSPLSEPETLLGCFCEDCARRFTLPDPRKLLRSPESFLRGLFGSGLLGFRSQSIAAMVARAAGLVRAARLRVGLDCFSTSLAVAVGQDLGALDRQADWIKIMTYGHTFAPAGVPFELNGALRWLVARGVPRTRARACIAEVTGIEPGELSSEALVEEVRHARGAGVRRLFAGMELVDLAGITRLDSGQIAADARAFQAAGADGLVLSWDLRHIPPAYLDVVASVVAPG